MIAIDSVAVKPRVVRGSYAGVIDADKRENTWAVRNGGGRNLYNALLPTSLVAKRNNIPIVSISHLFVPLAGCPCPPPP